MAQIYGWPFGLTPRWRRTIDPHKQRAWATLEAAGRKLDPRRCRPKQRLAAGTAMQSNGVASELPLAVAAGAPSSPA